MKGGIRSGLRSQTRRSRGGNSASGGVSNSIAALEYVSSGDANGLFYYLGTNQLISSWKNPFLAGQIGMEMIGGTGGTNNPQLLVDRQQTGSGSFYSDSLINSEVRIDLSLGLKFLPTAYTIQHSDGFQLINYRVDASDNAVTWDTLDSVAVSTYAAWEWVKRDVNAIQPYRYFRFVNTGADLNGNFYICISEIEFYGILFSAA